MSKQLRRWIKVLLLVLVTLPATYGGRALAQDYTIAGEWEITVEVVNGDIVATWIGRVWENNGGDEQLIAQRRVDISKTCKTFGDPVFLRTSVTLDGVDDYITCEIPDFPAIFATMAPELANCRCYYEGPPYASADVSPRLTTAAQPVIYHNRLHLSVMQVDDVADLELEQSISNNLADVGSQVVFSVTVTNQGPSEASSVRVRDELPSGYTYVDSSGDGTYNSSTGLWSVGALQNGASATLQLTATVNETGDYVNVAEVITANQPDPDSVPGNLPVSEDDDSSLGIDPNQTRVRFPFILTGAGAVQSALVQEATQQSYGRTQLTLHFNGGTVESWESNVYAAPQKNGFQVWAGYNASRYIEVNSEDGFADFLSSNGFWNAVDGADYVDGLYMWESEANPLYDSDPMPDGFGLGPGTGIYIGYNPSNNTYFDGTIRAVAVDPGCRGH